MSRPTSATLSTTRLRTNTIMAFKPILNMLSPFAQSVLRTVPTVMKVLLALLFLINMRSWPLVWHFRVFRPVFIIRFKYKLMRLGVYFKSKREREIAEEAWFDSISPIGENPFDTVIKYRSWASIDDSDFNGHLSNSSYPKTLDAARFKTALIMFPRLFTLGGWIPLAETHFHFIREIPILSPYEVRITMGSWDQKWVYVVAKFVTIPKKKSKKGSKEAKRIDNDSEKQKEKKETTPTPPDSPAENLFHASLRTPSEDITSTGATPFPSATPLITIEPTDATTTARLRAVAKDLASKGEPDGAILHTVSISLCCFKIGRITVPPSLVLAMNGYCSPAPEGQAPYSKTNPPPHWKKAQKVFSKTHGGGMKKLGELMKGGWRDVPEGERWWEEAFTGVEELRKVKLEELELVRKGMESGRRS